MTLSFQAPDHGYLTDEQKAELTYLLGEGRLAGAGFATEERIAITSLGPALADVVDQVST